MDVAIGVEQYVIGLDVAMNDVLAVYVSQSASKLGNPESNSLFGEGLSRNVEPQVSTSHQIDHKVPIIACEPKSEMCRRRAYMYSMSWKLYLKLQMKGWLTYSSIRRSRMMLRTLSDRTTAGFTILSWVSQGRRLHVSYIRQFSPRMEAIHASMP